MNLLINASNVRHGGGITVCLNLLKALIPLRPDDHFFLVHPQGLGYEQLAQNWNVTLLPVPESFHNSYFSKIRYNEFIFRDWCQDYNIQKVVSLGNVAFRCNGLPQLLYVQNAFLVYPDSQAWKQMSWKSFLNNSLMDHWGSFHLKNATSFAVQTEVMKERLVKRFEMAPEKVYLIPNAADSESMPTPMPPFDGKLKLLFLSHWYPHKNFEILIPLAQMIAEKSLPVTISLTLNGQENTGAKDLLEKIGEQKLEHILPNIGVIPHTEAGKAMATHDGLFLPTFLETFSGAYAEALRCGRPIFTSHYDFAVSSLAEAAFYFDPLSAEAIYSVLEGVLAAPETLKTKAEECEALGKSMPAWPEIAQHFSEVVDAFA